MLFRSLRVTVIFGILVPMQAAAAAVGQSARVLVPPLARGRGKLQMQMVVQVMMLVMMLRTSVLGMLLPCRRVFIGTARRLGVTLVVNPVVVRRVALGLEVCRQALVGRGKAVGVLGARGVGGSSLGRMLHLAAVALAMQMLLVAYSLGAAAELGAEGASPIGRPRILLPLEACGLPQVPLAAVFTEHLVAHWVAARKMAHRLGACSQ